MYALYLRKSMPIQLRSFNACVHFIFQAKHDKHITPYYKRLKIDVRRFYFIAPFVRRTAHIRFGRNGCFLINSLFTTMTDISRKESSLFSLLGARHCRRQSISKCLYKLIVCYQGGHSELRKWNTQKYFYLNFQIFAITAIISIRKTQ